MIYTPPNLTTNTGTPKAFAASRTLANWVLVTCPDTNTKEIYVGGVDQTNKSNKNVSFANKVGIKITPGTTQLLPSISAVPYIDLSTVFFDSGVNGEACSITYGLR